MNNNYIRLKEEGKKLFKNSKFKEAIQMYTSAIEECEINYDALDYHFEVSTCFTHRAMCYLRLSFLEKCIDDAFEAFSLLPSNLKSLITLTKALELRGDLENSLAVYHHVILVLNPDYNDAKVHVNTLTQQILKKKLLHNNDSQHWMTIKNNEIGECKNVTRLKFHCIDEVHVSPSSSTASMTSSKDAKIHPAVIKALENTLRHCVSGDIFIEEDRELKLMDTHGHGHKMEVDEPEKKDMDHSESKYGPVDATTQSPLSQLQHNMNRNNKRMLSPTETPMSMKEFDAGKSSSSSVRMEVDINGNTGPFPLKQRNDITILIQQLHKQLQQQKYICPNLETGKSSTPAVLYYFLISAAWWRGWLAFVTFPFNDDTASLSTGMNLRPGAINNKDLVSGNESVILAPTIQRARSGSGAGNALFLATVNGPQSSRGTPSSIHSHDDVNSHDMVKYLLPGIKGTWAVVSDEAHVACEDFVIVCKDVWSALSSWYGGGPAIRVMFKEQKEDEESVSPIPKDGGDGNVEMDVDDDDETKIRRKHADNMQGSKASRRKEYSVDSIFYESEFRIVEDGDLVLQVNLWKEKEPVESSVSDMEVDIAASINGDDNCKPSVLSTTESTLSPSMSTSPSKSPVVTSDDRNTSTGPSSVILSGACTSTTAAGGPMTTSSTVITPHCEVCRRYGKLRCSRCKKCCYCSSTCQNSHWKYHKSKCSATPVTENVTLRLSRGRAGLMNMGNTCYLNSSLQCLSHIFPMTKYYITNQYEGHINMSSMDSTQGKLCSEYANVLRELWLNYVPSTKVFQPYNLKSILGKINDEYSTMQQQDAHDVLELLLDRLHEDCNLVIKKPYVENSEGGPGDDDVEVSIKAWKGHKLRHNSVIQDTVGGQLRSQLVCPHPRCTRASITFDYHSSIQLAIPSNIAYETNRTRCRTYSGMMGATMMGATYSPSISLSVVFIPEVSSNVGNSSNSKSISPLRRRIDLLGFKPFQLFVNTERRNSIENFKNLILMELLKQCDVKVESEVGRDVDEKAKGRSTSHSSDWNDGPLDGELLLVELERTDYVPSQSIVGWSISRMIDNSEDIDNVIATISGINSRNRYSSTSDDNYSLAVYWRECNTSSNMRTSLLLQRKELSAILHKISVHNTSNIINVENHRYGIIGKPIMFSYDISWTCARFRFAIFKQISRILNLDMIFPSHKQNPANHQSSANNDLKLQMHISRSLAILLVDTAGRNISPHFINEWSGEVLEYPTGDAPISSVPTIDQWVHSGLDISKESQGDVCRNQIPLSKTLTIDEFIRKQFKVEDRDVNWCFCIDWNQTWHNFMSDVEACAVAKPVSTPDITSIANKSIYHHGGRRIPENIITLEDCLTLFTTEEQLDVENSWYCSMCKEHRQANKILQFWKLPEVLIIGLKRFESKNGSVSIPSVFSPNGKKVITGNFREKINTFVDFPINGLNMYPYCADRSIAVNNVHGGTSSSTNLNALGVGVDGNAQKCNPYLYDLFAVCNHYGRMGFGHYTAFARDWDATVATSSINNNSANSQCCQNNLRSDTWFCYDDDSVQPIQECYVKSSAAYILFYKRRCSHS